MSTPAAATYTPVVGNLGPAEILTLAVVALIVIGPDKLPALAKDAARLIRALRDMATGAQTTLRKELGDLGPELGDFNLDDLRALNPRTALTRMIFDDPDAPPPAAPAPVTPDPLVTTPQPGHHSLGRGERAPYDEDAT